MAHHAPTHTNAPNYYFVPCTLYLVPCTLYLVLCTLYLVLCTLYFVPCTLYLVLCTLYFIYSLSFRLNFPPAILGYRYLLFFRFLRGARGLLLRRWLCRRLLFCLLCGRIARDRTAGHGRQRCQGRVFQQLCRTGLYLHRRHDYGTFYTYIIAE